MAEIQYFTEKHNARRAAGRQGLDVATLEFRRAEDGRWFWLPQAGSGDVPRVEDAATAGDAVAAAVVPASAEGEAIALAGGHDEGGPQDGAEGVAGGPPGGDAAAWALANAVQGEMREEAGVLPDVVRLPMPEVSELPTGAGLAAAVALTYTTADESRRMAAQREAERDAFLRSVAARGGDVPGIEDEDPGPEVDRHIQAALQQQVDDDAIRDSHEAEFRERDRQPDPEDEVAEAAPDAPGGLPGAPLVTEAELLVAARDQARVCDEAGQKEVAWLLRALAERLEASGPGPDARTRRQEAAAVPVRQRVPRGGRDFSQKPVITSKSNANVQRLIDKIDAAGADVAALEALNRFSRSSTYYRLAGDFLDYRLARAREARDGV